MEEQETGETLQTTQILHQIGGGGVELGYGTELCVLGTVYRTDRPH